MKPKLEWYVWYYDCNAKCIKTYNVLSNREDYIKKIKKKSANIEEFAEELRKEMVYRFWGKFEWELSLAAYAFTDGKEAIRIDAWEQIKMNWPKFVDYCWNY